MFSKKSPELFVARSAEPRSFPEEFLFGAATASYQIEGAAFEGGRQASIWDTFAREPGAVLNADNGDVACDHYHRYRDDVRLMRDMGLQTYRFSVSWARVMPEGTDPNPVGLDFYSRLVDELLEAEIIPWLTLYHWDLPQALQDRGGWTNRDVTDRFLDYAMEVYGRLGDRVATWTTLNEPWCSSFLSYTAGVHAPGHTSIEEGLLASHHLLLSHGKTVSELRRQNADLDLGLTLNLTQAEPYDPESPLDRDAVRRIDGQFNRWFLDPLFRGHYPADVLQDIALVDPLAVEHFQVAIGPKDLDLIAAPIDSLGINYYHGELVAGSPGPSAPAGEAPTLRQTSSPFPSNRGIYWIESGLPRTGMGWEVDPHLLTKLIMRVSDEYTTQRETNLYITENGAAYDDIVLDGPEGLSVDDQQRSDYLELHLGAVLDAIQAGARMRGYFYWSLMDNYEWAWGYSKRFGIVGVDYDTQKRFIKASGKTYQRIIADRAITVAAGAGRVLREGTAVELEDAR